MAPLFSNDLSRLFENPNGSCLLDALHQHGYQPLLWCQQVVSQNSHYESQIDTQSSQQTFSSASVPYSWLQTLLSYKRWKSGSPACRFFRVSCKISQYPIEIPLSRWELLSQPTRSLASWLCVTQMQSAGSSPVPLLNFSRVYGLMSSTHAALWRSGLLLGLVKIMKNTNIKILLKLLSVTVCLNCWSIFSLDYSKILWMLKEQSKL